MHGYWQTTRHPWPCLVLVLALLGFYEACMAYQAMEGLQPFRAGLDSWLATSLQGLQWHNDYLPGLLIAVICIGWAVLLWDRSPPENISTLAGMFIESLVYALCIWGLGILLTTSLSHLAVSNRSLQAIALIGSGLFEEVLFRLLGFGVLFYLFKLVVSERSALLTAIVVSAVGFAAAHCLGPQGEAFQLRTFVFRSLAGACFALLFHYRGLGIAVGTHSAYNVLIGLLSHVN